jgi:hypothetical protein
MEKYSLAIGHSFWSARYTQFTALQLWKVDCE